MEESNKGAGEAGHINGTRDTNKRWAERLSDLFLDPKKLAKQLLQWFFTIFIQSPKVFASTSLALLLLLGLARILGYDPLYVVPPLYPIDTKYNDLPILRSASWVPEFQSQQSCLVQAKALNRPYVLQSAVQYIQYEDEERSPGTRVRQVHERILYRLLPLHAIAEAEKIFLEEYSGSNRVAHWYGPYREIPIGGSQKYQVSFASKRGEPLTIVTGAEFEYPLPLADGRSGFIEKVTINHDRDFWYYENIDDVICDLTQVIDSRTLHLFPVGRGGIRVGKGPDSEGDVVFQAAPYDVPTNSSLLVHWQNVVPGEDVGLVFTWR